ncbi:hypothetical protein EVG20_g3791 [Dentipellis fragilis]|uniref:DUF7918 domain-containing protein n=1 Tax=Dentipellis fragilis TaxID=205917 RepID=A0A4Y9Z391_9AGAM|nr:hypothetical protein EVG20_g3791 [Dentipellis fragilis]
MFEEDSIDMMASPVTLGSSPFGHRDHGQSVTLSKAMALNQSGLEFSVLVAGKPLVPHDMQSQVERTVSAYIASSVGKQFELSFINDSGLLLAAWIYMDGRFMEGTVLKQGERKTVKGVATSSQYYRPFQFSALKLTDNDDFERVPAVDVSQIGLLEVKAFRISPYMIPVEDAKPVQIAEINGVPERSKKLGSHSVSHAQGSGNHQIVRKGEMPGRARDKKAVKAERSRSPIRVPSPSLDFIDLTQTKATRSRPRRHMSNSADDVIDLTDAPCKVERPGSPIHVPNTLGDDVIDLTDD